MVYVDRVEDKFYYEVEDDSLNEDEGSIFLVERSSLTGMKVFYHNGDNEGEEVENGELKDRITTIVEEELMEREDL